MSTALPASTDLKKTGYGPLDESTSSSDPRFVLKDYKICRIVEETREGVKKRAEKSEFQGHHPALYGPWDKVTMPPNFGPHLLWITL